MPSSKICRANANCLPVTSGTGTSSSLQVFPNAINVPTPKPANNTSTAPNKNNFDCKKDFCLVGAVVGDFFCACLVFARGNICVASGSLTAILLAPSSIFESTWISSKAVGRISGFLLIARKVIASSIGGICERNILGGVGSSSICFIAIETALSPVNGNLLVSISYITIPSEYTSDFGVIVEPCACSGEK